jgi:hypothetical protein
LAGPLFISSFNLSGEGISRFIVSRFYLLPETLLVVPLAMGVDGAVAPLVARWPNGTLSRVCLAGLVFLRAGASLPQVREDHQSFVESHLANILSVTPPEAVLFTASDTTAFGIDYVQKVGGQRVDVVAVRSGVFASPTWYRDQVARRLPLPGDLWHRFASEYEVVDALLEAGHPLVIAEDNHDFDGILEQYPSYGLGPTIRILPRNQPLPPPEELEAKNGELYKHGLVLPAQGRRLPPWDAYAFQFYALPWQSLAFEYGRAGNAAAARRMEGMASRFGGAGGSRTD